jgi:hypothetical protein
MASHGEAYPQAELHRLNAALSRSDGDLTTARAHLETAIEVAQTQGAILWKHNAQKDLDSLSLTGAVQG